MTSLQLVTIGLAFLATILLFGSQVPHILARRTNMATRMETILSPDERERARILVGGIAGEHPTKAPAVLPGFLARRFMTKEHEFARAGIAMTAREYYMVQFGLVAVGLASAGLLGGGIIALMLSASAAIALPTLWVRRLKAQRLHQFTKQLEPAMRTAANSLKAGQSLGYAIRAIAEKIPAPLGTEFAKASAEITNANVPPVEALAHIQDRIDSSLFGFVIAALKLQTSIGGNLVEIFGKVADTVRERVNLRDNVHAKTAQGRTGGYVVAGLPFVMIAFVEISDPSYMQPFFSTARGEVLFAIFFLVIAAGVFLINKLTDIRIERD